MKNFYSAFLTTMVVFIVNAQNNQGTFEWAKRLDEGRGAAIRLIADAEGNTYTVSNENFEEVVGNSQSYISKFNTQGDLLWSARIHSIDALTELFTVKPHDIALDNEGNLYIAGYIRGNANLNPGTSVYQLTSSTWTNGYHTVYSKDAFILKLNAQGNFVWAKKYAIGAATGNPNNETYYSIVLDNAGNIYAAGENTNKGLLSKINSNNGNVIWHKEFAPKGPKRMALSSNNHLVMTGYFSDTVDFDPDPTAVYNLTSKGVKDAYILTLDTEGQFIWVKQLGGTGNEAGNSLTTDSSGNVYVTGYYNNTANYQNSNGTTVTLPNAAAANGFIAKLNADDGAFLWVSSFRNAPSVQGAKIDDIGYGITLDQDENIYVTASAWTYPHSQYYDYCGITNFGQKYVGNGGRDIGIFKLNNTNGDFSSIYIIGGIGNDYGRDIATDADNNIYVTGVYNDKDFIQRSTCSESIDFDPSPDSEYYLTSECLYGRANRFIMKLSQNDDNLGIETISENSVAVKIYPNPTDGMVYFSEAINLQVTNALGQIITNKNNATELDLSGQPTGMYFITSSDDKGQVMQRNKIVKK